MKYQLTVAPDGRVVVYMGDDEMDQHIYKFISEGKWDPRSKAGTGVLEMAGLLDKGTLYVARFNADGTGTGETRRFLTGPRGCEITRNAMTPDRKTMFVNIQHPGEPAEDVSDPNTPLKVSSVPDGPNGGRPRSATLVIRKQDGGFIGS